MRKTFLAITGAAFISLSLTALIATAYATHENRLIRLSEEGSKAAHGLLLARVAIFGGKTEEAVKLVAQAKTALTAATKDADKQVIKPPKSNAGPMISI